MSDKDATAEAAGGTARRKFLLASTSVVGGVSAAGAALPFVASLRPSEKTRAAGAPIVMNLTGVAPGELRVGYWRRKAVWALRRDAAMLAKMEEHTDGLADPDSAASIQPEYCKNANRSIKPEFFIAIGLCTHLGCSPGHAPASSEFLCACHGSRFDYAGRVFKGSPAPSNLIVPAHHFISDTEVLVGEDPPEA